MQTGADSPQKSQALHALFNLIILHVFCTVSSLSSAEPFLRGWNQLCVCVCVRVCLCRPRRLNWCKHRQEETDNTRMCVSLCVSLYICMKHASVKRISAQKLFPFSPVSVFLCLPLVVPYTCSFICPIFFLSFPSSSVFSSVFSSSPPLRSSLHSYLCVLRPCIPSLLFVLSAFSSCLVSPLLPRERRAELKRSGCCGEKSSSRRIRCKWFLPGPL